MLSVRVPLSQGQLNQYQMNVIATDNRVPQRSSSANVIVDVVRDVAPVFVNFNTVVQLDEADIRGKLVTNVTATDQNLIVSRLDVFWK